MIRIQFNKEGVAEGQPATLDIDADSIGFNQIGCIVLTKGQTDTVGMFPAGMVAGVYMPEGPNLVKPAVIVP